MRRHRGNSGLQDRSRRLRRLDVATSFLAAPEGILGLLLALHLDKLFDKHLGFLVLEIK